MSGVFQNIDPPPSPHGECVPPRVGWVGGGGHTRQGERGVGSIFWKTPDTALYSIYVSTVLCGSTQREENKGIGHGMERTVYAG